MAGDSIESAASGFAFQVERFYASLISAGNIVKGPGQEPSLGGRLLYAGELDAEARALLVAANIAGAASLAATADAAAGKQAIRDGVVDFLVTSLDEALRILKNEIRKRETVAVCVAAASEAVEGEMLRRGVAPDLARPRAVVAPPESQALLTWNVASAPAIWLPKLDAVAAACLQLKDETARRWLRLAPRYLGRLARGSRLLVCHPDVPAEFIERARRCVEAREIPVPVEIQVTRSGTNDQICLVRKGL